MRVGFPALVRVRLSFACIALGRAISETMERDKTTPAADEK